MSRYTSKVRNERGRGFSAEVRIEGLEETVAALRAFEPDALKAMQKEIREEAWKVARLATSRFSRTGHSGSYAVRSSYRGKRTGMSIRAVDKETSIFEFAGTKGRSRTGGPITPQGMAMIRWLYTFGRPGRFLWGAYDATKDEFNAQLKRSIDKAERELQRHLDSVGEAY